MFLSLLYFHITQKLIFIKNYFQRKQKNFLEIPRSFSLVLRQINDEDQVMRSIRGNG